MLREPAPTRRERRRLFKALRKLRQPTKLVEALNTKAQLQAQRRAPPRQSTLVVEGQDGKQIEVPR